MEEKTTVGNMMESVLDDAVLAPEDTSEPISEALNDQPAEQQTEQPKQPKEPGWMKGRIDAAVSKAVRDSEARIRGEYEQRITRMQEAIWDREAQDLVDAGEFKSLDLAKEYIRLKGGAPAPANTDTPRDEQGRFAKQQEDDPVTTARAQLLATQAQKIKERRGIDVMQAFNDDPEIKQKVISGDWDFYDVAEQLGEEPRKRVPTPARTPNGANTAGFSFANMTDEQWKRFNQRLEGGAVFDVRK